MNPPRSGPDPIVRGRDAGRARREHDAAHAGRAEPPRDAPGRDGQPSHADVPRHRAPRGAIDAALREVVGMLDVGFALVRPDWTVVFANEAFGRLAGRPTEEILDQHLGGAGARLHQPLDGAAARETCADGRPRTVRIRCGAGGRDVVDVHYLRTSAGLLAVRLRPVPTAEVEAESEAMLRHELSRALADTADVHTHLQALCELAARACLAGSAAVATLGDTDATVLASVGGGLPGEGATRPLAAPLRQRVAEQRAVARVAAPPFAHRPPADAPESVDAAHAGETMLAPLVAYDEVVGVLVVRRDRDDPPFHAADERRLGLVAEHGAFALWKARLLAQAEAASEAKGAFLTTVSHELRTPLTALDGYGELLADGILGPLTPEQQETVQRMHAVTQSLAAMIDEMLTATSLEAGREVVRAGPVATAEVLQTAAAVIEPLARQKGLHVEVVIPPDAPVITTDAVKVRQILRNLAENAVKFTHAGGVTLSLEQREGELRFRVRDTGIGIPASGHGRIFRPFTQLDGTLTRRYGGTGIGLYIASRLARLLGGRIELESAPGKGSTFELVLQVRSDQR
ncbi:MAG TPA: ATP-binding protein [Gemmatimonadaceae bacterium]|nr:ATP-binding protein [Gemmatimonadaceae bacterium]